MKSDSFTAYICVTCLLYTSVIDEIIADFDAIEIDETVKKPKVGVVGEILVKFHPDANNNIIDVIESVSYTHLMLPKNFWKAKNYPLRMIIINFKN